MTQAQRISLYYTGGTSDKEYHLQLELQGDGWMVKALNGKRGGTLTTRDKTKSPVSYEAALKPYEFKPASQELPPSDDDVEEEQTPERETDR